MVKNDVKMIGLKLDFETLEMIECIMKKMKIRTYTQVVKQCLFSSDSLHELYNVVKESELNVNAKSMVKNK